PARPRAGVGADRGEHLPGRAVAGAALLPAPGAGLGALPHACPRAVPVRLGSAPRWRDHGRPRPAGRARDPGPRQAALSRSEAGGVIVIGGGHNGLVCATRLARAGLRPLVLERRDRVGGAAVTEEFHPGFHVSAVAHLAGLRPGLAEELGLAAHGLITLAPE